MASEEMSFENADNRQRMPAYIISSPMSLRLSWDKKINRKNLVLNEHNFSPHVSDFNHKITMALSAYLNLVHFEQANL